MTQILYFFAGFYNLFLLVKNIALVLFELDFLILVSKKIIEKSQTIVPHNNRVTIKQVKS